MSHEGLLSEPFEVKTGVRQGCLLSPFLFLLAIDWIMRSVTDTPNNGIQWTPWEELDDLALLSHNHTQMQQKRSRLAKQSIKVGLRINKKTMKVLRMNTKCEEPIIVD